MCAWCENLQGLSTKEIQNISPNVRIFLTLRHFLDFSAISDVTLQSSGLHWQWTLGMLLPSRFKGD